MITSGREGTAEQNKECDHATFFCSGIGGDLRRRIYAQLCTRRHWPRGWSWRICAESYDSFRRAGSAGAGHGEPDSRPAGATCGGTRHQRTDLTTRFPGLDRNWGVTPRARDDRELGKRHQDAQSRRRLSFRPGMADLDCLWRVLRSRTRGRISGFEACLLNVVHAGRDGSTKTLSAVRGRERRAVT
jgi:hypothetical protein